MMKNSFFSLLGILYLTFTLGCEKDNSSKIVKLENYSDEPYYKYLWHIDSKNSALSLQGYGVDENADINITSIWSITKGNGVKVAVIDDAYDVNHEDLKENLLVTYDVVKNSSDVSNKYPISEELGTSHGNTCAGFICAPINKKGIIGTAPESKLIAIKLESNFDSDTIKAFEYAKNQGAKVISCSWGSENISQAVDNELQSLYDANITVVFAAGNDKKNLDSFGINDESESKWVIGVGASGENNDVTPYSNYGSQIDIIAPGGDAFDSIGILGIDDSGVRGSNLQRGVVTNDYAFTHGTSFSTPVTAGVVALMYSVNPDITPKRVREILINNSDKIGLSKANYINGFDQERAYGKLNAGRAVQVAKK